MTEDVIERLEALIEICRLAKGRTFDPESLSALYSVIDTLPEALSLLRSMQDSTRPDYDFRCGQCGRAHIIDTSLPSSIWNQIARPEEALCPVCIDQRLQAAGLEAEAEFYYGGKALFSKMYATPPEQSE